MSTGNGKPIVLVILGGAGNNVLTSFASASEFSRAMYQGGQMMPQAPALQLPMWCKENVTEADLDNLLPHYIKIIESGLVSAVKFIGKIQNEDRLLQLCLDKKIPILH